jgi:hypothetical protein
MSSFTRPSDNKIIRDASNYFVDAGVSSPSGSTPMELSPPANSFMEVLRRKELQESLLTQASQELGEVALAVKQTNKKGTLILTLTIEPEKGGALSIMASLQAKAPSTAPQSLTIFYLDNDTLALVRDNPEQKELPLVAHDGGKQDEQPRKPAGQAINAVTA